MELIKITEILDPDIDMSRVEANWNYLINYHMTNIYYSIFNIDKNPSFNAMKFVVKIHDYMISMLNFRYEKGKWNICEILSQIFQNEIKYNCSSLTILTLLICNRFNLFQNVLQAGFTETHMFIISHNKKWIFETTRRPSKWRPVNYINKNCGSFMTTDTIHGLLANYCYSGFFRDTKKVKHIKYTLINYPLDCPEHLFWILRISKKFGTITHKRYLLKLIDLIKLNHLTRSYIFMIYNLLSMVFLGVKDNPTILSEYQPIIEDLKEIIRDSYKQNPTDENIISIYFKILYIEQSNIIPEYR